MEFNWTKILDKALVESDPKKFFATKNKPSPSDLQHALAEIAKLSLIKNSSGKISATLSIKSWTITPELSGMMKWLTHSPRGDLLRGGQTDVTNLRYSALVPLVLSAFKEYNNIQYSAWDWTDPWFNKYILDRDIQSLQEYITNPIKVPKISIDDKMAMVMDLGMPAESCWSANAKEIAKFPRLMRVIMLQTWLAHPLKRNKYMILDLEDIDSIPASIYGDIAVFDDSDSPFHVDVPYTKTKEIDEVPW